jgi:hypothetical protein
LASGERSSLAALTADPVKVNPAIKPIGHNFDNGSFMGNFWGKSVTGRRRNDPSLGVNAHSSGQNPYQALDNIY